MRVNLVVVGDPSWQLTHYGFGIWSRTDADIVALDRAPTGKAAEAAPAHAPTCEVAVAAAPGLAAAGEIAEPATALAPTGNAAEPAPLIAASGNVAVVGAPAFAAPGEAAEPAPALNAAEPAPLIAAAGDVAVAAAPARARASEAAEAPPPLARMGELQQPHATPFSAILENALRISDGPEAARVELGVRPPAVVENVPTFLKLQRRACRGTAAHRIATDQSAGRGTKSPAEAGLSNRELNATS